MYIFSFPIFLFIHIKWLLFYISLINTPSTVQTDVNSKDFQSNYESFNNVLQSFSNDDGNIDYTSIRSDPSNVRIDHINKEIYLSRIFKWYKKDFLKSHEYLLLYIFDYLDDISTKQRANIVNTYQIIYNKYDWSLNE
jgi:hypothetical protein